MQISILLGLLFAILILVIFIAIATDIGLRVKEIQFQFFSVNDQINAVVSSIDELKEKLAESSDIAIKLNLIESQLGELHDRLVPAKPGSYRYEIEEAIKEYGPIPD